MIRLHRKRETLTIGSLQNLHIEPSQENASHRVFLGLRTDKKATDVIREIPKPAAGPGH